jgi:hypothetical protein
MSLGCGPQAGNITSDNISARHLVNVKRAAFLRRDWTQLEARDHQRAADLTREGAPRGSGMGGDPALSMRTPPASSSAFTAAPGSNWQGNPSLSEKSGGAHASAVATPRPKAPPMSFGASAPALATYSAPAQAATPPLVPIAPPGSGTGSPRSSGPYVGSAFDAREIQALMAHAGAGCPMGACKGCPHHDVSTSSCGA